MVMLVYQNISPKQKRVKCISGNITKNKKHPWIDLRDLFQETSGSRFSVSFIALRLRATTWDLASALERWDGGDTYELTPAYHHVMVNSPSLLVITKVLLEVIMIITGVTYAYDYK